MHNEHDSDSGGERVATPEEWILNIMDLAKAIQQYADDSKVWEMPLDRLTDALVSSGDEAISKAGFAMETATVLYGAAIACGDSDRVAFAAEAALEAALVLANVEHAITVAGLRRNVE